MKLYVCWTTKGGRFHACGKAHDALRDAGHEFEVAHALGHGLIPTIINTPARRKVEKLSGDRWVPILVLDDDTVVNGSDAIVEWAEAHQAT